MPESGTDAGGMGGNGRRGRTCHPTPDGEIQRLMLVRIKGAISNCYLLLGTRPVLVDTGAPGDLKRLLSGLKAYGVAPKDLALILLTHGHSNHAGCAAELRRRSGAHIALHIGDTDLVRHGRNGVLAPQDTLGRVLRPFVDENFEAF
jgi:hydroxyacylglutathione hydrolase